MIRFFAFLGTLAFLTLQPGYAQPTDPSAGVSGTITDSATGEGLPSATIALYQGSDSTFVTGTTTGPDGSFSLEQLRSGTYHIRFSFVGYRTVRRPDVDISGMVDLGEIALAEDTAILETAQVEAEREFVEQRADRTVYNVADQPVNSGSDVLETLRTLPSVEVDSDDNISLRGGKNVAIHVNGRPVPVSGEFLTAYLKQISSENVERIEVMPNPSARYEPDGMSGIINIVLKEGSPDRGLAGGLTLGGGTQPRANVGGNLSYQKGIFDSYVSYGYRYGEWNFTRLQDRDYVDETSTLLALETLQDGGGSWNSHYANATVDITPATGTTVSLNGSYGINSNDSDSFYSLLTILRTDGRETLSERRQAGEESGTNASGSLSFQKSLNEDGTHELRAEARTSWNSDDEDETYTQSGGDAQPTARWQEHPERTESSLQIDYTLPLAGNVRIESGAKASYETMNNDVLFGSGGADGLDSTATDGFDYDRTIYAAYAQAAVPIGEHVEAQAGLRLEHAERSFTQTSLGEENVYAYTSLFPSAFLMYTVEPGTSVKASYSRRIDRPGTWALSPFSDPSDPTFRQQGNPNLKPEYTDSFELAFQYKFDITLTPFYRRTTDLIWVRLSQDGDVTVIERENFATQQAYGADLTLSGDIPGTPVKGFLTGSLYRSETDGGETAPDVDFGNTSWSLRANLQATLTPTTSAQIFGMVQGPFATQNAQTSTNYFTSLGVTQKLLGDRLTLKVRVNDPFNIQKFEFESLNDVYAETGSWNPSRQSIGATLTWTFGEGSKKHRPQQDAPADGGGGGGIGF